MFCELFELIFQMMEVTKMSRKRGHDDEGMSSGKRTREQHAQMTSRPDTKLQDLITRIGEKSNASLEDNLSTLSVVLDKDMSEQKKLILSLICNCVISMPWKITIYSTLVGLINQKKYNVGGECVDLLVKMLKRCLKELRHRDAVHICRFIGDLVNCNVITAMSVLGMFESFVEVLKEEDIPQARSDWYVFMVLAALPWCGKVLAERKEGDLERILFDIDKYITSKRKKSYLPMLRVWSSNEPHPQEDYLDSLWEQILTCRKNKWIEHQLVRPYVSFNRILTNAHQHTLHSITTPPHTAHCPYPLPKVTFRMFDYTDCPEDQAGIMPGHHSIDRYLIEDWIEQILIYYHLDRKECAEMLLQYPNSQNVPHIYCIVECVFGHIFRLPQPPFLELFYSSLLIEICKKEASKAPVVLAQATELLYERLTSMHTACIDRFINWFSYNLSNFQFKWDWSDWSDSLTLDPIHPKQIFMRETLLKCLRLSYHDNVKDMVPDTFAIFVPPEMTPVYRYRSDTESLNGKVAAAVKEALTQKKPQDEILHILNEIPDNPEQQEFNADKIDVFVQTLFSLASQSFTHTFSALTKFHEFLKFLAPNEQAMHHLLMSVHSLWRNHEQMMLLLTDKLLKTETVSVTAVMTWIFSSEMQSDLHCLYVWEIFHVTLKRMEGYLLATRQSFLKAEQDQARKKKKKMKDSDDDDSDDSESSDSDSDIDEAREKHESAEQIHKSLFLIIFRRFVEIMTDHLTREKTINTPWYKYICERLQMCLSLYGDQVAIHIDALEQEIFTPEMNNHVLKIFKQFKSLYGL